MTHALQMDQLRGNVKPLPFLVLPQESGYRVACVPARDQKNEDYAILRLRLLEFR